MTPYKCPRCTSERIMDRRRAFASTYGLFCLIVGVIAAIVGLMSHHYGFAEILFGAAVGGILIMIIASALPPKGTQTCMNCGSNFEPDEIKNHV